MKTNDGTLTLRAANRIKVALKARMKLIVFCKQHGFNYTMFTQWLGGFRKDEAHAAEYIEALQTELKIDDIIKWANE